MLPSEGRERLPMVAKTAEVCRVADTPANVLQSTGIC